MKPLVCIFAHPDDEAFGPGGTIASTAAKRDVYLICVTSGDAGSKLSIDGNLALSEIREQELLQSAEILGIKKVDFLRFKDGSLCNNRYHEIAGAIKERLDVYQPDTVMTFNINGVSGHIDHIVVALTTSFLFPKLSYLKTLLYFCETAEMTEQLRDYFVYVPPGYKRHEVDIIVDVAPYWNIKLASMRAHQSQLDDANKIIKLLESKPKEEYFKRWQKGKRNETEK